jgi:hypothetical protein
MLITVFGTPSALTYWLVHVARNIAEVAYSGHFYITVVTLDDLRSVWADRNGRAVVFHSDCPQGDLVELFLDSNLPYLVSSDLPMDVVGYAHVSRGLTFREALRFTSQSLSILTRLRHNPRALYLNETLYAADAVDVIGTLAAHFGLSLGSDELESIKARLFGDRTDPKVLEMVLHELPLARQSGSYAQIFSVEEQSIIQDTIETYGTLMEAPRGQHIVWRPEVVPDRDNPELLLDGPREMLGPARIMFGGHTLHLPAGRWKASIILEIAENYSGNRLVSQVYVGSDLLEQVTALLPVSGVLQYEMQFEVLESFFPVQVLVCIAEGAIEGQLMLRSMTFDRIDIAA